MKDTKDGFYEKKTKVWRMREELMIQRVKVEMNRI